MSADGTYEERVVEEPKRRALQKVADELEVVSARVRQSGDDAIYRRTDIVDRLNVLTIGTSKPIDKKRTKLWAIAPGDSAGYGLASFQSFELVNRHTGRAHDMEFVTVGPSVDIFPVNVSTGPPSYTTFTTDEPVNFSDFAGLGTRVTSAQAIFGSVVYLTLWDGPWYLSPRLAYVRMGGWGLNTPGLDYGHGITMVSYGDGERSGLVRLVLEDPPRERPRDPRVTSIQVAAMESPRIDIPNDVLFEFDSAELSPSSESFLYYLADQLNNRLKLPVEIEGHTDSVGPAEYNMELSRRRGEALKQWFVARRVLGAENFTVVPYGETDPVAPNETPDGSDNPEGRKQNRRVSIRAAWNVAPEE